MWSWEIAGGGFGSLSCEEVLPGIVLELHVGGAMEALVQIVDGYTGKCATLMGRAYSALLCSREVQSSTVVYSSIEYDSFGAFQTYG